MPDGLVTHPSAHSVAETMDRLAAAVVARGMTVFVRVDHGTAATEAGMDLRPTELLVFGQAKGGTPLMQASQTAGIDLPLKALCWADEAGVVRLGYNDPLWIARRHDAGDAAAASVRAMGAMLEAVSGEACRP
ncbi:DUF302 domain-containing protein [Acidisphaera rubrifaciens]|uniref:DUF302 domain-containing protein n=1 Tax=Acidisphaera rubrifaciens HS-AP3 TaxID=1231350 RepID=A0A0D6PAK2_9PROT|nr:DUF302 domain-containing protein [Acidisphaera rubrifaciens]GAN78223.1 hypothetical protein Asru_0690_03 [Acidisphaera rubrifaciens HS-AP3]